MGINFKIKVYLDDSIMPGGDRHLGALTEEITNKYGDMTYKSFVFEVVEGQDEYNEMYYNRDNNSTANTDCEEIDNSIPGDSEEENNEMESKSEVLTGFAAVAGMKDLKEEMISEVKWIIDNKEMAEQYGLHVPNGMLLYGYPGCGKTFFAEKLAEELGVKFMIKHGSDLGSYYMHQTEQNIGKLFSIAKASAPCIVCIDEIDGFLPYRRSSDGPDSAFLNSEVNEFLSQMNNCGKDGVMVIGTTNNPQLLDPALLRTGRMDKLVYVPLPDEEAREEMLKLMVGRVPCEDEIDYKAVSEACDGMVMSDMECMFHKLCVECARENKKLSTEMLSAAGKDARRSVCIPKEDDNKEQVVVSRGMTKIAGFARVS